MLENGYTTTELEWLENAHQIYSEILAERKAEKRKEQSRQYYQANRDKRLAYSKHYAKDHPEQIREYKKRYHALNKELISQKKKERYARKKQEQEASNDG